MVTARPAPPCLIFDNIPHFFVGFFNRIHDWRYGILNVLHQPIFFGELIRSCTTCE